MKNTVGNFVMALGLILLLGSTVQAVQMVESDFTNDADGWRVVDFYFTDGPYQYPIVTYPVDWQDQGGNPGGHIFFNDPSNNAFFFEAPEKYLGNKSAFYGGKLTFSATASQAEPLTVQVLVLTSSNMTLIQTIEIPQTPEIWTDYEIYLTEDNFIDYNTRQPISQQDMINVLSDLQGLRIPGEWTGTIGLEIAYLDNVQFSAAPEPASLSLLAVMMVMTCRRKR